MAVSNGRKEARKWEKRRHGRKERAFDDSFVKVGSCLGNMVGLSNGHDVTSKRSTHCIPAVPRRMILTFEYLRLIVDIFSCQKWKSSSYAP